MPGKKKKGKGGGKKKGGKKKAAKGEADKNEELIKCRVFLKAYQRSCTLPGRICSPEVVKLLRESMKGEKPAPVKFALDGSTVQSPLKQTSGGSPDPTTPPTRKVLQPLADSWVETKYRFVRCLYVWNLALDDDAIVSLALYFESAVGVTMKALEIREAGLSPWAISRLARSLRTAQLSSLNLDYNSIPKASLVQLCDSLRSSLTIQTLSLNFCEINSYCGEILGSYIATSGVREVSLIGNALTCYGCSELIKPLVVVICEAIDSLTPPPTERSDQTEGETKVEPAVEAPSPPPPALTKLFLQDNSIDVHSPCRKGSFNSILCTREIKKLLMSSACLKELRLEGNSIGDGGAREVMEGLILRKEVGLPTMKVGVTSCVSPDLFAAIVELTSSVGTKKKGKKKRKKKKR